MHDLDETSAAEATASADPFWNRALVWSTLGLFGWLAFELTAQPALVAAILCTRFGWNDLLTAVWLRRHDPIKGRARACSWFCLASGVMKMVLSAFGLAMIISTVMAIVEGGKPRQNPNPQFPEAFWGPAIMMTAGTPVLALLALIGCVSARMNRIRVWIDSPLTRARQSNIWPPDFRDFTRPSTQNVARGPWLAMVSVAMVAAVVFTSLIFAFSQSIVLAMLALIGMVVGIGWLSRGVFASHPGECWGDDL